MKRKINIALVGSGAMGRAHSAAVANLRYCYKNLPFEPVLHTLVTGDPEKAPEKASELGFEGYTDSLEKAVSLMEKLFQKKPLRSAGCGRLLPLDGFYYTPPSPGK